MQNEYIQAGWILLACAAASVVLLIALIKTSVASRWLDVPVDRSLHTVPTPRVGGIAIWLSVAGVLGLGGAIALSWQLWLCLAAVFFVSLLDDRKALPASLRLAVHLLAAGGWSWASMGWGWHVLPAALAIAWMANLFNFMDGADGFSGGMAVIGFATLGVLALQIQHAAALPAIAACGAVAGFLLFNFPPARLFMGDAGSVPLGFLAGVLALWGMHDGVWTVWVPMLAFGPFILDASVTLVLRVMRGSKPWEAHREHLYQRWVLSGWSHRKLLAVSYPVMLASALLAAWVHQRPAGEQTIAGLAGCLLLATLYGFARWRLARPSSRTG